MIGKYIFIVGGVMSTVGKGITAASIGRILQSRGITVTALKIDPYVNVDAGTMNPTEHGEVFVLDDGTECDQDMGNYERFLNTNLSGDNYMTTGSIYLSVINRERNLEYDGQCVSVVPHIPLEVINQIETARIKNKAQVAIVEIGGTVGEYENILFLEAVRILKLKQPHNVLLALVSYLPTLSTGGTELKTKPTQHAVRNLNSAGLQPDLIFGRAAVPLDKKRKEKLAFMCGLEAEDIISAPNASLIYEIPLLLEKEGVGTRLTEKLKLKKRTASTQAWKNFIKKAKNSNRSVKIAIVGKYFGTGSFVLEDSYISVIEALKHAAFSSGFTPKIDWLDAENFEGSPRQLSILKNYGGIVIPGGFGSRGVEGKISAIRYARERKIPYLGLCYGMQLAVIEFSRSVLGFRKANTTEIDKNTPHPVIDLMPDQTAVMAKKRFGGTMRLGAYPAILKLDSLAAQAYGISQISERHRHRYEVNPRYIAKFEQKGLVFSGKSPDGQLMEISELPREKHPFFLGTQFHPELKSRPLAPHPLFKAFLAAAAKRRRK